MTRRAFFAGAAVLTVGVAALVGVTLAQDQSGPASPAPTQSPSNQSSSDQTPSKEELMAPGPLGDEAQGSANAPVTIIEYASMTCPHCAGFDDTVFPWLKSHYIDTGKVRYILREFPLDPLAAAGFMLARCAGNGKYFDMIHALFQHQNEWVVQKPLQPLLAIAEQAGFTQASFDACLNNQDILKGINQERERAATKFGVNATPTFFINGKRYVGELTTDQLEKILQADLGT